MYFSATNLPRFAREGVPADPRPYITVASNLKTTPASNLKTTPELKLISVKMTVGVMGRESEPIKPTNRKSALARI